MGSRLRPKLPECKCKPCVRWNVDVEGLQENVKWLTANPWMNKTKGDEHIRELAKLKFEVGCELCGQERLCVFFIPDIVREFFKINTLCVHCRLRINRLQRYEQWPICWSDTPDDEIKWFLIAFVLHDFQWHFAYNRGQFIMWLDCCIKGAHAQRAEVKPEPYVWAKPDWLNEDPEELDIKIELKPEFRTPRVRARQIPADV